MASPFYSENCSFGGTWSAPPNGFSGFPDGMFPGAAYQFVPVGESRTVPVQTHDQERTLTVVDAANAFGGIEIRTSTPRALSPLFDIFRLPPFKQAEFEFRASSEATRVLVLTTPGEASRPALYVRAGRPLTVHYAANVILRDCVQRLDYSEPRLLALLRAVEAEYARQANIRLLRVGPIHGLVFKEDTLGRQILTNSDAAFTIREHIAAAGRGHLKNLVYGWDFEEKPRAANDPDRASGLTGIGNNVSFIDWGNPAMVTIHELGHALCLEDRLASDVTIMQKYRSFEPYVGFDGLQIEALRMIAGRLP